MGGRETHGADRGDAHERERDVADVWRLRDHLATQADRADDALDGDPDRDGDVEQVVHAEEELHDERDVFVGRVFLARRSKAVRRSIIVVVVVSAAHHARKAGPTH